MLGVPITHNRYQNKHKNREKWNFDYEMKDIAWKIAERNSGYLDKIAMLVMRHGPQ
jgi:hypothetical protein